MSLQMFEGVFWHSPFGALHKHRLSFLLIFSLFWANCAVADRVTDQSTTTPEFETIDIKLIPGAFRPPVILSVKVAKNDAQQRHGLMFLPHLPAGHGMLFVFESDAIRHFWMKNTQIPLDILFFDSSGRLVSISRAAQPFSLRPIQSTGPARFVLEINAGHASKMGVQTDAKLLLP